MFKNYLEIEIINLSKPYNEKSFHISFGIEKNKLIINPNTKQIFLWGDINKLKILFVKQLHYYLNNKLWNNSIAAYNLFKAFEITMNGIVSCNWKQNNAELNEKIGSLIF